MRGIPLVLGLVYDIVMIGLGSYGAYILFSEFVEREHIFSINQILSVLRKRWYALLALSIALILFFYQLFNGLGS
ncbi:MAG: hypothetical protein Q8L41_16775 [Anaerolineales bacterium]|nr:hypothetical protein [Anaerolineales bacterium]